MTIDPPERAGAWRSAGSRPFFILFGQIDRSGVDTADSLTDTLPCWVWVTDNKLLRVTTMTTATAGQSKVSVGYGQRMGDDGMLYLIYNWDGARDFTIIWEGEVTHGTACEEWVGWDLARREQYLDECFGRGEWSWK